MSNSFEETSNKQYLNDNTILRENSEQWSEYGTLYWPSITIDKLTFRGDLNPENILEAVCATLNQKPDVCVQFYREEGIAFTMGDQFNGRLNPVTTELLAGVVILLVLVNLILIYAYRQCAKKEMEQDMQFKVSSAVSEYIALSQQNGNTSIETA